MHTQPHAGLRSRSRVPRIPRPHSLALALAAGALLTLPLGAQVLPSGAQVVAGQAQIAVQGGNMTVTNTANTILNWNSFSIGAQNAVRFQQPNAASQVLNRVGGSDPSQILGQLSSNGKVWLLNPNGVLFGQGARIDVAGLVASTLRLNDSDWLAGRLAFNAGAPGAGIVNQGQLRSTLGGRVVLLGGSVRNEGLIEAPGGQVLLAAGDSMELVDTGAPHLTVRLTASQGQALNLGQLRTSGGRIDVHAAVVNQQGLVQADALSAGPGGEIVLQARERLNLADGSTTSATAAAGQGGDIQLLGREVGLFGHARVDASGRNGGGQVRIGGGLQGRDASVPNADAVYFGRDATVQADATQQGDGGRIILWSDKATRAFGSLSARGGAQSGQGGFIETSGGWLDARPLAVDVGAAHDKSGQWLLDPYNITISDSTIDNGYDASFNATADNAQISTGTIATALNAGTNVTITTGNPGNTGTQSGQISANFASIQVNAVNPGSLTLIADADIDFYGMNITSSAGAMPVSLLAGRGGSGGITLNSSTIRTGGGNLLLGGFGTGLNPDDSSFAEAARGSIRLMQNTQLDAGPGRVEIYASHNNTNPAIDLTLGGANITAADIVLRGYNTAGTGIFFFSGEMAATHSLLLSGRGATEGVDSSRALSVTPSALDNTASLTVIGRSDGSAAGVWLDDNSSVVSQLRVTNGAALTVSGANIQDPMGEGAPAIRITASSDPSRPLLDSTNGGGAISVSTFGTDNAITAMGHLARTDAGALTMDTASLLFLDGAQLDVGGPVDLRASAIELGPGTRISSGAGGDALWLRGQANTGLNAFRNFSDADALTTPFGRWIIWGDDVMASSGNFLYGGLAYDFKRYGVAGSSDWAGDAGNGLVFSVGYTATINVTALDKVYDGTTLAQLSGGGANGINGDIGSLRPGVTSVFTDPNAGTNKTVLFPGIDAFDIVDSNGKPVYGYVPSVTSVPTANITPAPLSGTVTGNHKVYDATTGASLQVSGITGLIGTETVLVSGLAAFGDKNVGTNKLLSGAQFSLADGSNGGLASNYFFSPPDVSYRADITPLSITVAGLVAANKVYDANTNASLSGSASVNALSGDQLLVTGTALGQFADKNVGTGKPITVTGLGLSGVDADNYLLTPTIVQADITPLLLNVNGLSAASKVYDANTNAILQGSASVTALSGDQLTLGGTASGQFADKNAGTGKLVTVGLGGMSLGGADAGNYILGANALQADITPLQIQLNGLSASNKVYDAGTQAVIQGSAGVTALAGDQLSVQGAASGRFSDKNVGTGKAVTVSGLSLSGTDADNYRLTPASLQADITPLQIQFNGLSAANKVYDARTDASLNGSAAIVALSGDQLTLSGTAVGQFSDKNAGTGKSVLVTGLSLGGADAGNYRLSSGGLQADITPAQLLYVADATSRVLGMPLTGLGGRVSGFVGDETQADATTGTLSFTAAPSATTAGTHAIAGSGLSAQNYQFAQASANAQALQLLPPLVDGEGASADRSVHAALQTLQLPEPPRSPLTSGLADISSALPPPPALSLAQAVSAASAADFGSVRLASLSMGDLQAVLDARDGYKKAAFAESISQLEQDPSLADMKPCSSMGEAAAGNCLVTEALKAQAQAAAVTPDATPATPSAAAPAPATPPAAAAAPAAAAVAAATAAAPAAAAAPVLSKRRVQNAALPQIERKVALVIGVDRYADTRIPQLSNAVGDAQALGRLFESRLGYETLLVENASKASVVAALNRLALELGPRDSVLIYYAGHGELIESTGQGYWQLSDSDAKKPESWLSNADIARLVQQIGASQVALISDSCYSGALADGERIRATPGQLDAGQMLTHKAVVAMSSGGNEPVFDAGKNGHSPFAWSLMQSLGQVANWQPGGNVFERVRFAVARELPQRPRYGAAAGHQRGGDYLFEQRQLASRN